MFSNNNRISTRQVFRLFVFDFIGMSTLVLPAKLAETSGCDSVFAIVAGGLFASLYLWYLAWIMRRMDSDLITYVRQALPRWGALVMLCFFAAYCILEASYGAYIFADVMKKGLVGGESYTLLLLLILAVAAYAIQSGIESRARVYESLFWVLFVPLFLLLWIAASDVNTIYLHSFFEAPVTNVAGGGLLVFEYLMLVFLVLFFPAYVKKDAQKKMVAAVYRALWVAVLVFIVFDLILLGSFGERAMAKMRYPALTLMSNIHLRGSFLKRLDAFLLAIWFFTLFALINVFLFYAKQLIAAIGGEFTGHGNAERQGDGLKIQKEKNAKVWSTIIAFLLVFVVAEGFCYGSFAEWFEGYMTYVAMPILILLPLIIVVWGTYRKTGNRSS